jgi:hypothetical protein
MSHLDYRTLINQGRKAGLNTADLYRAMSAHPVDSGNHNNGRSDSNGYVADLGQDGKIHYRRVGQEG